MYDNATHNVVRVSSVTCLALLRFTPYRRNSFFRIVLFHTNADGEVPGSLSALNTATRVKKDKLKSRLCCSLPPLVCPVSCIHKRCAQVPTNPTCYPYNLPDPRECEHRSIVRHMILQSVVVNRGAIVVVAVNGGCLQGQSLKQNIRALSPYQHAARPSSSRHMYVWYGVCFTSRRFNTMYLSRPFPESPPAQHSGAK